MNYTKGEWVAEQDTANSIRIFSQDSEQIASVMDYDGNDITEEMEANAHLIAAAPDMYEALIQAMRTFQAYRIKETDPRYLKLRRAAAKAEGREEK